DAESSWCGLQPSLMAFWLRFGTTVRGYRRKSVTYFRALFYHQALRRRDGTRARYGLSHRAGGSRPSRVESKPEERRSRCGWRWARIRKVRKSVNPSDAPRSPLTMAPDEQMSDFAGDVYRLACLELRGGNRAAVYRAELPGLNAWISCRPLHPATRG